MDDDILNQKIHVDNGNIHYETRATRNKLLFEHFFEKTECYGNIEENAFENIVRRRENAGFQVKNNFYFLFQPCLGGSLVSVSDS